LSKNHIEEIHGLSNKIFMRNKDANDTSTLTIEATKIDLLELAKRPLPKCPLAPELNMHWLVIDNVQPKIPENPNIIIVESDSHPVDLPKEMQVQYF
jgi:transcription initiation factor TFIID subunit 6